MTAVPPQLEAAFTLFLKEMDSHLAFFREAMEEKISAEKLPSALTHKMHLMKGAAGFFQLAAIRDIASDGEKKLKAGISAHEIQELLPVWLNALEEEVKKLQSFSKKD